MIKKIIILLIFSILLTVSGQVESTQKKTETIKSGCEYGYPPYCLVNNENKADGFSVELLEAALKSMGYHVSFKTGSWDEIKNDLETGELQTLPLVGRTPEREKLFDFTFPYLTMHGTIVVRDTETQIKNLNDLKGKKIAVMKGDNAEEFLHRKKLDANIITTADFSEALDGLSKGNFDAVVIQRLLALQLMQANKINNLQTVGPPLKGFVQNFCFAVKKGDKKLLAILNEGLAIVMADGTFRRLHHKWFSAIDSFSQSKSRIIVGGDNSFPPYEFLDKNGQPTGYNVELSKAIAKQIGINVDIRLEKWDKIRNELENGSIDIIHGMFYSPERNKIFSFSPPHTYIHYIIASYKKGPVYETMEDLKGKKILVMKGDIMHDLAIKYGYEKDIIAVSSQKEALQILFSGKYSCALVAKTPALYWIKQNEWNRLKLSKKPLLSPEYCFATMKNNEALQAKFTDGLAALKKTGEYRKIYSKWLGVYEKQTDWKEILNYIIIIVISLILMLMAAFIWVKMLRQQVRARTKELRARSFFLDMSLKQLQCLYDISRLIQDINANIDSILQGTVDLLPRTWQYPEAVFSKIIFNDKVYLNREIKDENDLIEIQSSNLTVKGKIVGNISVGYFKNKLGDRQRDLREEEKELLDAVAERLGKIITHFELENELNKEQEFSAETLKTLAALVVVLDREGKIIKFNHMCEKTTGFSFAEVAGKKIWDILIPKDEKEIVKKTFSELKDTNSPNHHTNYWLTKQGGLRLIEWSNSSMLDSNGKVEFVIGTGIDITERKIIEEQLKQSEKMQAIGQLAGGIAHDFNNQLAAVLGYADLLLFSLKDPQHRKFAENIKTGASRSADLTKKLLTFSRKGKYLTVPIEINQIVDEVLSIIEHSVDKNIDIKIKNSSEKLYLKGDPSQIQNAILNIIINARDAMPDGGKLTIDISKTKLNKDFCINSEYEISPGNYIKLSIADTGCGIDKNIQKSIFEPFFTTKQKHEGTGMGLASVYGAMKNHNGAIEFQSELNKGSKFTIYLPIVDTPEDPKIQKEESKEIIKGRGNILVVDDEAIARETACDLLKTLGYSATAKDSGKKAIAFYKKNWQKIDLVILDMVMPEMDGHQTFIELKKINPKIKSILSSGYSLEGKAQNIMKEGVSAFIGKPYDRAQLSKTIARLF